MATPSPSPDGLKVIKSESTKVATKNLVVTGLTSKLIANRFLICDRLGSGSFGEVYSGVDKQTLKAIAVKVEQRTQHPQQLMDEHATYKAIPPAIGIPQILFIGSNTRANVLIMDRLGLDLETLFIKCKRRFSIKTICLLAIQMLDRIEHHHTHGYIHRDLKPQNFVMGPENSPDSNILHLIDYGLCCKFRDTSGIHLPYSSSHSLVGTPRYVSTNCHMGIKQTRRDDLESIGYILLYFYFGKLPWQGIQAKSKDDKYAKILKKKLEYNPTRLCRGAPTIFKEYLEYCRSLKFSSCPDYEMLRRMFRQEAKLDDSPPSVIMFDWSQQQHHRPVTQIRPLDKLKRKPHDIIHIDVDEDEPSKKQKCI